MNNIQAGFILWPSRLFHIHVYPSIFMIFLFYIPISYSSEQTQQLHQATSSKLLIDILDDAEFAITERNMRITGRLNIGKTIRERSKNNFPDYEVIMFCNLSYAKQMLELEPEFINSCPLKITIRDTGKDYVITAPLLPENTNNEEMNKLTMKINSLIREIVEFSAEDWFVIYDQEDS